MITFFLIGLFFILGGIGTGSLAFGIIGVMFILTPFLSRKGY